MANPDKPFGFRVVKHLDGAPFNGALKRYSIAVGEGTATFRGDIMQLAGSADADGVPTVLQAAAADTQLIGVMVDLEVDPDSLGDLYRLASTARYILIADAPDLVLEAQEDSVASTLAAVDTGENVEIVVAAGSTASGVSAMELDSSSHTAATAQIRLIALVRRPGNVIGANAIWEVMINEHAHKTTSGI